MALFGIGGTLLRGVSVGGIGFHEIRRETVAFVYICLFVVFLPLAAVAFFLPLWSIHHHMEKRRTKVWDEFANRVAKLEQEIRAHIDRDGELDKAKIAKEKLEIMQVIHPYRIGYPVWPFDRSILLKLFSPQILGVVGSIVGVLQSVSSLVSRGSG